jgi:hypothetical protein
MLNSLNGQKVSPEYRSMLPPLTPSGQQNHATHAKESIFDTLAQQIQQDPSHESISAVIEDSATALMFGTPDWSSQKLKSWYHDRNVHWSRQFASCP